MQQVSQQQLSSKFGGRALEDKERVYEYNSWDNVEWEPSQLEKAKEIIVSHRELGGKHHPSSLFSAYINLEELTDHKTTSPHQETLHKDWNRFYSNNQGNFFKDRHWFESELSHLFFSAPSQENIHILEVGCGAGNSIFPILEGTKITRPNLFITGCDFSKKAIELVQSDPRYDSNRCRAFVHDISSTSEDLIHDHGLEEGSVDIILMVFVLSALSKVTMSNAIKKLSKLLKPNTGQLFLRDYGLYDLAQLRLRPSNWIEGNQYRRGDGTLMYFFSLDELRVLFENEGFTVAELKEDRRLLVNRKRQLQMYRIWIQARFSITPRIT